VRLAGAANNPALSGDGQYWLPYLHVTAPQQFAMFARSYMSRFGVTAEDLGAVAVAQREYAISNPKAMMRQPLTIEQYMDSRWIAEPLRLYDCCLETDAAVALVVTSTARARDLRHPPVTISATVTGGGNQLTSNHHADLTDTSVAAMAKDLYESAQITPADVDVAELYDAFSPLVLLQLEQYGFCQSGEAAAFVRDGQTRRGGSTPTNTHGGHLSEGYVHGLNHVVEAVEQLRHSAGARQVPGAEVAISTAQPGINSGLTGAVALRRLT
jgi:acetyl-CoA acetyltransferase